MFLISLLMLDLFCWFLCFYQLQERLWLHILYVEKETCAVDFARGTNFGEEMTAYLFCWFYPWHKPYLHYEKSMIVSWLFVWPIWVWSHTLWNMQWFQFTSQYLVSGLLVSSHVIKCVQDIFIFWTFEIAMWRHCEIYVVDIYHFSSHWWSMSAIIFFVQLSNIYYPSCILMGPWFSCFFY